MSLRRRRNPQYLELTTTKNGTFEASITRVSGAPACVWKFADGEEQIGDSCSKALDGSEQKVVLKIAPKYIAVLTLLSCGIIRAKNMHRITNCTFLDIRNNPALSVNLIDVSAINEIRSWSELVGDIANFDGRSLTADSNSRIYGNLSTLSPSIYYLYLNGCINITGTSISHMRDILTVLLADQSATQARINAIIDDIWQHRADFTYAGGITCNLDGNNAAPSGNVTEPEEGPDWHLDGETWIPLTAGAKVFDLVNDVNSEGFNFWNIAVT